MHNFQLTYEDLEKKAVFVAVDGVVRVALLPSNPVYSQRGEYQPKDVTM